MSSLRMKNEPLKLDLKAYPHIPDSELFKVIKCLPNLHAGGPWIAGGSVWRTINNEPLNNCDIDVFFLCKEQYEEMCSKMNSYPYVNNVLSEKKNKWNTTYQVHVNEGSFNKTIDVQFIGMSYRNSLSKLLDTFDFPVCQFGYDGRDIIMGDRALSDLEKRQLSIHRLRYPKSFFKHMLKYLNNGFTLPPEELKLATKTVLDLNVWSKNASGKYDEDDNCKMVEPDYNDRFVVHEERPTTNNNWYATGVPITNPTTNGVVWENAIINDAVDTTRQRATNQAQPTRQEPLVTYTQGPVVNAATNAAPIREDLTPVRDAWDGPDWEGCGYNPVTTAEVAAVTNRDIDGAIENAVPREPTENVERVQREPMTVRLGRLFAANERRTRNTVRRRTLADTFNEDTDAGWEGYGYQTRIAGNGPRPLTTNIPPGNPYRRNVPMNRPITAAELMEAEYNRIIATTNLVPPTVPTTTDELRREIG